MHTPRRENCHSFDTRAQAEAAAFRPCMRCRPEIAPELSHMDPSQALAETAARLIEHAVHRGQDSGLTNALGSPNPKHITAMAEAWHPCRAFDVRPLWHRLEVSP